MAYKMDKDDIIEAVEGFNLQVLETASKIGEKSAFGFLFGDDNMTITAETVARQYETFAATIGANS